MTAGDLQNGTPLRRSRLKDAGWSVGVAALVNLLILGAMVRLNEKIRLSRPQEPVVRLVTLPDAAERPPKPAPPRQDPAPEPQVMTVVLDMTPPPMPQPQVAPVHLALAVPQVTAVFHAPVAVQAETAPVARESRPVMQENQVDQPPRELAGNPVPRYPPAARRRGLEGVVVVRLLINTDGRVESVEYLEHQGDRDFRDAVDRVVSGWRFTPAMHQGQPVKVWGIKTFRFELGDRGS